MPDPRKFPIGHLIGDRNAEEIAQDLQISTRTVQRWIEHGVNWEQADVFAAKALNLHPITAFGPAWAEAADAACPASEGIDVPLSDIFDSV